MYMAYHFPQKLPINFLLYLAETVMPGNALNCEFKVLSREKDLADIRLIPKAFINERGRKVCRKIWPPPIL
jgi:hypothetical protein